MITKPKQQLARWKAAQRRLQKRNQRLLDRFKADLPALEKLLHETGRANDFIYRFYHQSFKVFGLQTMTMEMVTTFKRYAARKPLNAWFLQIVAEGTGKTFQLDDKRWLEVTRPIVEAFFHARYFLEMICESARMLKKAPNVFPSGWAAVLYLYNQR